MIFMVNNAFARKTIRRLIMAVGLIAFINKGNRSKKGCDTGQKKTKLIHNCLWMLTKATYHYCGVIFLCHSQQFNPN